jgi:trehalose utilization protein
LNRRTFLGLAAVSGSALVIQTVAAAKARPIRVVVWDEQQPAQKQAYEHFLGNQIAGHLFQVGGTKPEFSVKSVRLDDPDQGLSKETLDNCDVLIWWGHVRHDDVKDDLVKNIVQRIQDGRLSLIALHSAHWSKPFVQAMNARAIQDALSSLPRNERAAATVKTIPAERRLMRKDESLTPSFTKSTDAAGRPVLEVKLPSCVFPAVRADGKPSHVRTLLPRHPIAKGVPATFDIPQTEMYDEPFHVPKPDATLFEERWDAGERFLSGSVWSLGKGQVFYFRPGHETYDIFKQPIPLKIVENAVRHLGSKMKR